MGNTEGTIGSVNNDDNFISRLGASFETGLSSILSDGLPIWFNQQVVNRGRNSADDRTKNLPTDTNTTANVASTPSTLLGIPSSTLALSAAALAGVTIIILLSK